MEMTTMVMAVRRTAKPGPRLKPASRAQGSSEKTYGDDQSPVPMITTVVKHELGDDRVVGGAIVVVGDRPDRAVAGVHDQHDGADHEVVAAWW